MANPLNSAFPGVVMAQSWAEESWQNGMPLTLGPLFWGQPGRKVRKGVGGGRREEAEE